LRLFSIPHPLDIKQKTHFLQKNAIPIAACEITLQWLTIFYPVKITCRAAPVRGGATIRQHILPRQDYRPGGLLYRSKLYFRQQKSILPIGRNRRSANALNRLKAKLVFVFRIALCAIKNRAGIALDAVCQFWSAANAAHFLREPFTGRHAVCLNMAKSDLKL